MNINVKNLQKAFNLAHKAGLNVQFPIAACEVFHAIAREIWQAAGEAIKTAEAPRKPIESRIGTLEEWDRLGLPRESVVISNGFPKLVKPSRPRSKKDQ